MRKDQGDKIMDDGIFKKIGNGIVDIAPTFGKLLMATGIGAPAGAAIEVVAALGKAFGLGSDPDPVKLATAMLSDPEARLKVVMAENNYNIEVIKQVNETMRSENASEHWPTYSWRPFWGFISAISFMIVCSAVCYLGYQAIIMKDTTALTNITQIIASFATLFAIPGAILGIASWKRGQMQVKDSKSCK
jgi:hypothetical protein